MIRIGVDSQIAEVSRAGSGQFTARIFEELIRTDRAATYIPLKPKNRTRDFSMPERLWWDQVALPRLAKREKLNVLFKPAFSCPVRSKIPTVVVLHDLVARLFPRQLHKPSAWFYGRFAPWTLRFAARVIAASEQTANDARTLIGIPRDHIHVVVQGVDAEAIRTASDLDKRVVVKFHLTDKFILHVGTIEPRKNLAFLIRVFSRFHSMYPDYSLVLAGSEGWLSDDVHRAAEKSNATQSIRFLGSVTNDELFALFRLARVLAFPTLYEGFGRPPLEAMAAGTPVVAARTSSIPEVVGDAGILISGYDEEEWANALIRAAEDTSERECLRNAGIERSSTFTWSRAAREISEILHEVAHG
ncbi:MAG: glycosyltransferase family 1 protein [Candidatus Kerfeldbacteria bacterium]